MKVSSKVHTHYSRIVIRTPLWLWSHDPEWDNEQNLYRSVQHNDLHPKSILLTLLRNTGKLRWQRLKRHILLLLVPMVCYLASFQNIIG